MIIGVINVLHNAKDAHHLTSAHHAQTTKSYSIILAEQMFVTQVSTLQEQDNARVVPQIAHLVLLVLEIALVVMKVTVYLMVIASRLPLERFQL
jgi:hypothetical protein